jgi:DNA-binding transcriptional LysR family regulator
MEVKQQEYFAAIVEEGSISKAAKKLFISQPTLSQFLSKLEASEGSALVTRSSSNSLRLTEAGKLYYESAKKILMIRDSYQNKLHALNCSSSTNTLIGNNMGPAMKMLSKIVSDISPLYPGSKVSFRFGGVNLLHQMVANNELDMAFSGYKEKEPQFKYIDFPPLEMAIVLPSNHPLAHLGSETMSSNLPRMDLKCFEDETFIMIMPNTVMRDITDEYCREHDIKLNVTVEACDARLASSAVNSGLGISIYPPDSVSSNGNVRYIGLNPPLYYKVALYYNSSAYQSNYTKDYIKAAKRLAETGGIFTVK